MVSVAATESEAELCDGVMVAVRHISMQSTLTRSGSTLPMWSPSDAQSINKRTATTPPGGTSDHRVVSSGRAAIAYASSVPNSGTVLGTDHYTRRRGSLLRIHHLADFRPP